MALKAGASPRADRYRMYPLVRRLLFLIPPEHAHKLVFAVLRGVAAVAKARGHRDEFVTMDMGFDAAAPAPEHQPGARASDCGAGPIGFAGTVRKEAVVKAAGLTTLAGDDFGGGPTMPMMPGTWTHDQGVFDEHR